MSIPSVQQKLNPTEVCLYDYYYTLKVDIVYFLFGSKVLGYKNFDYFMQSR